MSRKHFAHHIKKQRCSALLTLFLALSGVSFAQDTLNADMVKPFVSHFRVENQAVVEEGEATLKPAMQTAQFVLLGETHDDAMIAAFTDATLTMLRPFGFRHFFTEHGKAGLKLLLSEAAKDGDLASGLHRINTSEYRRLSHLPFPFLSGVEDARFMETALNQGYHICGLDQEFFYAYPFLFDQILEMGSRSDDLKIAHRDAMDFLMEGYRLEAQDPDYPLTKELLASEEIAAFFRLSTAPKGEVLAVFSDIILSMEIYEQNRLDRKASFASRGDLMERNLNACLGVREGAKADSVKAIIKLGAMHTMRGHTPLGIEDVGEHVHQISLANGTKDINIHFMFRYYLDDEEPLGYFDNADGNSTWVTERHPLTLQGDPEKWTLIDLSGLRAFVDAKGIFAYTPVANILDGHDFVVIPPASRDVTPNYDLD